MREQTLTQHLSVHSCLTQFLSLAHFDFYASSIVFCWEEFLQLFQLPHCYLWITIGKNVSSCFLLNTTGKERRQGTSGVDFLLPLHLYNQHLIQNDRFKWNRCLPPVQVRQWVKWNGRYWCGGNWDEHNETQSNRNAGSVSRWALLLHCSPSRFLKWESGQEEAEKGFKQESVIHTNPSVTTRHACERQINEKYHQHRVKYSFTSAAAFLSINSLDLDAELQWKRVFAVLLMGVTSKSNSFENSSTSVSEIL